MSRSVRCCGVPKNRREFIQIEVKGQTAMNDGHSWGLTSLFLAGGWEDPVRWRCLKRLCCACLPSQSKGSRQDGLLNWGRSGGLITVSLPPSLPLQCPFTRPLKSHHRANICWLITLNSEDGCFCTKATPWVRQSANYPHFPSPPTAHTFSPCTHAHKHTLNRCPVGLNFSVSPAFDLRCAMHCINYVSCLSTNVVVVVEHLQVLKRRRLITEGLEDSCRRCISPICNA